MGMSAHKIKGEDYYQCRDVKAERDKLLGEVAVLLNRLEASEADALEQARLNGMGAEREMALMAKLEAAEKERDELRTELKEVRREVAMTHYTIKTLHTKVEGMEQQEPVAWCATDETETVVEALGMNKSRRFDTALYLAPGAKGE